MENCIGKELVEAKIKSMSENNEKFNELTLGKATELVSYIEKALCCATYPVNEKYFSWKHLWWKKKVTQQKVTSQIYDSGPERKLVRFKFMISNVYGTAMSYNITIYSYISKTDEYITLQRLDGDDVTDDDVLNFITKKIAEIVIKSEKENDVH